MSDAPSVAPHYRWQDLPEDAPLEGLRRRRVLGEKAMLSRVALEKGCSVASHDHDNEQFVVLISGTMRFCIAEGTDAAHQVTLREGEVLHLPSGTPHSAFAEEDSVVLDIFSPPSEGTGLDELASS